MDGGIVRHEEPEGGEDEELDAEAHPVDVAPGGVVCHYAGEDAGEEDAECRSEADDGEVEGSPFRERRARETRGMTIWTTQVKSAER